MKRTRLIFGIALLVVLCVMTGCMQNGNKLSGEIVATNQVYDVFSSDDGYFLKFHDLNQLSSVTGQLEAEDWPQFSTISHMKESILNNTYPKSHSLSGRADTATGILKICDLDAICEPVLPVGMYYYSIYWYGETYSFNIAGNGWSGILGIETEQGFQDRLELNYHDKFDKMFNRKGVNVLMHETDPATGAEVLYYSYSSRRTIVRKEHHLPDGVVYVWESWDGTNPYVRENCESAQSAPFGYPDKVCLYGEINGKYFYATLLNDNNTEIPSQDWYNSFGLKLHLETVTE